MDGAEGKGLDIVSGNVVDASKVVLAIHRNQLKGVMQARIADKNTMNVTVSVRVEKELVPVIGMSLKRVDALRGEVGSGWSSLCYRRCCLSFSAVSIISASIGLGGLR